VGHVQPRSGAGRGFDREKVRQEVNDRERVLGILAKGAVPQAQMYSRLRSHRRRRERKHVLHDLEYEGLIKLDWDRNYKLP